MRRFWLATCVLVPLLPGLALAQSDDSTPPGVSGPGVGDDGMMGPDGQPGDWRKGHGIHGEGMMSAEMLMNFYAANTTHDGHLTLAQAKAADFKPVADHFNDIDVAHRGYVTFYDIAAWRMDVIAKRLEQQAALLRARD